MIQIRASVCVLLRARIGGLCIPKYARRPTDVRPICTNVRIHVHPSHHVNTVYQPDPVPEYVVIRTHGLDVYVVLRADANMEFKYLNKAEVLILDCSCIVPTS